MALKFLAQVFSSYGRNSQNIVFVFYYFVLFRFVLFCFLFVLFLFFYN